MALTWLLLGLLGGLAIGIPAGWLGSRWVGARRQSAAQASPPEPQAIATAAPPTATRTAPAPARSTVVNTTTAGHMSPLGTAQPAGPEEAGGTPIDSGAGVQPTGIATSSVPDPASPAGTPRQPFLGEEADPHRGESQGPIGMSSSTEAEGAEPPDLESASRRLIEEMERRYGSHNAQPRRPGS
ncbi:MAG: hypothetical protein ACR2MZ_11730 [Candidatus Dormibacter sp.]|uniref:hypothetical protein n=1 Tax=Candidatus Dormibacter sp. TaxID=2973982 RepID=UPI000DB3362D|nr:MAG: hypothetical protein DLM66_03450 [Candidatus Dormibacteraeota bacterium]